MPVNYGSYQIDPFQGFNQGLTNIGQALQYRREMERQRMLDAENKRLRDLQVEESGLRIGGIKAEREALSNLYTPEGTPPLDLAGTITAQMKKEQEEKKLTTRNARFKFYLDVHKSLGGSPEEKNKVMQNLVGKDPDEDIKKIALDLKIAGGKISFTQTVKENEIKLPDGNFAQPGVYDIEGEETGDPAKPVRITGAKRREEKVKGFAPQAQSLVHPKTGVRKWFDMNKEEDIKTAQKEGFVPYEKPEKPEKLSMTDVKSAYSMDVGNIKNQMMVEMTPDEQMTVSNLPPEGVMALLMSGKVGKSLSPERKKYYIGKLQEAETYYGGLTDKVLGRKGAEIPQKIPSEKKPSNKVHPKYKTAEDVKKAYQKGDLNWEESSKILVDYFNYVP